MIKCHTDGCNSGFCCIHCTNQRVGCYCDKAQELGFDEEAILIECEYASVDRLESEQK